MQQLWGCFGVIINNNKLILQQRNDPGTQFHKKWALPGGIVQFGEHPENTLIRRVSEEIGINIDIITLLSTIHNFIENDKQLLLLYYLCTTQDTQLNNYDDHDDILKVAWFDFQKIKNIQLLRGTGIIIREAIKLINIK